MIEVDLPDGSVAEFPDGTTPEVMKRAISKKFPVQPQQPAKPGYGEDMLRSVPSGLRSGVEGLLGAIGSANQLTGDLAAKGAGYLGAGQGMQDFVRNVGRRANLMPFAPTSEEIGAATDAGVKAVPGSENVQAATRYQPQTLPGKIVRTGSELLPNVMAGPGGVGRKILQTGASAAASELAGAATEGTAAEPWARVAGMVAGGAATAARDPKVAKTATEEVLAKLNKNKEDAYALSEKAGVIIKPEGMKSLYKKVADDFADHAADPGNEPGAHRALARIEKDLNNNVTLKGLDTIRKMAGNSYELGNKSNNSLVAKIVKRIDELIDSKDPAHMAGIDTKIGAQAIDVARKFAHRAFKLETVTNLVKKGNIRADTNITDTRVKNIKSQLSKINDPYSSWGRGFNAAEKEAAGKAAKYTPAQRALHGASVLNPFGGGKLSAGTHIAAAAFNAGTGNLPALALQAGGIGVGMGFAKAAEALAAKSVDEFVSLVANGGVPAPVAKQALLHLSPAKREAITRTLLSIGGAGQ